MAGYFTALATQLGISIWLLCALLAWSLVWKLLALWKSARKGSVVWFVVFALVNTVGILPILYIFVFSKMKCCQRKIKKKSVKKKK
jgi:hypothetical protein